MVNCYYSLSSGAVGQCLKMSSAYGDESSSPSADGNGFVRQLDYIPVETTVKDGLRITIDYIRDESDVEATKRLMNEAIEEGMSWPFDRPLSDVQFRNYFLAHSAFVVRSPSGYVIGAFYCKPNFPGRCAHFCNGGFITDPRFRGRGIATAMGKVFLRIARDLDFEAVFFNLVFTSNLPSIKVWDRLGFQRMARLPGIGRLRDGTFDALQYYYDLRRPPTSNKTLLGIVASRVSVQLPRLCLFAVAFILGRRSICVNRGSDEPGTKD